MKNNLRTFFVVLTLWLGTGAGGVNSAPLVPAGYHSQIGMICAKILSREHFRQEPIDEEISKRFLERYLNALDYNHLMFLQSDIDEFQKYGTLFGNFVLQGDVRIGFEIYSRFLKRVEERVQMVSELLKEEYHFDEDEKMVRDRSEEPWPKTVEEARKLWKQRVKFEMLQGLNKKTNAGSKKTNKATATPAEVGKMIKQRYERLLRSYKEEDSDSIMQIYMTALAHAYDPHSDYMDQDEMNNFAVNMSLSLEGIGAVLSSDDGYVKIVSIVPGGPADLDKRLKVNDRISGVAQDEGPMVDVVGMKLNKVVQLIRGKKKTKVRLQVMSAQSAEGTGATQEISIVRDKIRMEEAEVKGRLIEVSMAGKEGTRKLGYVEIPAFYADLENGRGGKSVSRDVRTVMERLKSMGAEGYALDLRKNGGGSLPEVVELTGLFVRRGPVVQVKDVEGRIRVLSDDDSKIMTEQPMVIMVTHMSASASEIFAAAMQDYGRAVVVGHKSTFGKGTVQRIEDLNRYIPAVADSRTGENRMVGGALKFTVQKFYRISGGSTQYRGVVPDIMWPSQFDYLKINESALKYPLPYDEIPPADYRASDSLLKIIPELRQRSVQRIGKDVEFGYIREDMSLLKIKMDEKTVSLNLAELQKEMEVGQTRLSKRKEERKTYKSKYSQYTEVSLKSIEEGSDRGASFNRKVMEQASANMKTGNELDDEEDEVLSKEHAVDPEYDESLNILTDLIQFTSKK